MDRIRFESINPVFLIAGTKLISGAKLVAGNMP
jgi:hypothetical protein